MKYVLVIWDDASVHDESTDDISYVSTITYTVGILAQKNRDGVVLFTDYVPSLKSYHTKMCIPRGMIKKIVSLVESSSSS